MWAITGSGNGLNHWPLGDMAVYFKLYWIPTLELAVCEITLRWMPHNLANEWTTVQVMALCHQAPSHYLGQCCLRCMAPYVSGGNKISYFHREHWFGETLLGPSSWPRISLCGFRPCSWHWIGFTLSMFRSLNSFWPMRLHGTGYLGHLWN